MKRGKDEGKRDEGKTKGLVIIFIRYHIFPFCILIKIKYRETLIKISVRNVRQEIISEREK